MAVDFAKVKIPLVTLCVAFLAFAPRAGAQCDAQRITLKPGWNAVYVEVSPEGSAADISASWPVDSVGVYDPSSFLSTLMRQGDITLSGPMTVKRVSPLAELVLE